ncbi:MAG: DUF1297 domain-containing protein [Methanobacteriota archaeon]
MGERVVEKSIEMFGGMTGTNLFPAGSPYTEYTGQNISMGRRIALEIKRAVELNKLDEVLS